ncbi:MAG: FlgD immunoglobulin-like domain containing protein, partial [candidate division WOR-3 bacterium]
TTDLPLFIFSAGEEYVGINEINDEERGILSVRPNPFKSKIEISYKLNNAEWVNITIYDKAGRVVRILTDRRQNAGEHRVIWDGTGRDGRILVPGIYLIVLNTKGSSFHKRVVKLE